jgi:hypothetical protein
VLIFCIPVFAVVCYGEVYMRNRPSLYEKKNIQISNNADSIEVLILGNSHTTYGIYPEMISSYAYSLAFEDQSIFYDKKLLERYLPLLSRLKYVFINIDYHNLCFRAADNRAFFYKYYYDIDYDNRNFWKEKMLQSFFVYSPRTTWTIIYNDLTSVPNNNIGPKGGINRAVSIYDAVTSIEKSKIRAAIFNDCINMYDSNELIMEDFEQIITRLKAENITPILITCPSYWTMRACLDKRIEEKCKSAAESLSEKYNILYLNYFNDDSFEISDYYDSDHLNIFGAVKLTTKIDSVITQLDNKYQQSK